MTNLRRSQTRWSGDQTLLSSSQCGCQFLSFWLAASIRCCVARAEVHNTGCGSPFLNYLSSTIISMLFLSGFDFLSFRCWPKADTVGFYRTSKSEEEPRSNRYRRVLFLSWPTRYFAPLFCDEKQIHRDRLVTQSSPFNEDCQRAFAPGSSAITGSDSALRPVCLLARRASEGTSLRSEGNKIPRLRIGLTFHCDLATIIA